MRFRIDIYSSDSIVRLPFFFFPLNSWAMTDLCDSGLGALAVIITTYLALTAGASPGLAALAITSAQALVQSVYWLVSPCLISYL